jgi:aminopeptidase YwaD
LIAQVIDQVDAKPKLAFLKTRTKSQAGRASFKVTLGIMPSYAGDTDGLKVDGVSEGRPAFKAGILTGDVIVKMGEYEIHDIQNYMDALGKFEKGQTVVVQVKRGEQVLSVGVTF